MIFHHLPSAASLFLVGEQPSELPQGVRAFEDPPIGVGRVLGRAQERTRKAGEGPRGTDHHLRQRVTDVQG